MKHTIRGRADFCLILPNGDCQHGHSHMTEPLLYVTKADFPDMLVGILSQTQSCAPCIKNQCCGDLGLFRDLKDTLF